MGGSGDSAIPLKLTTAHLRQGLARVRPSGMREVEVEVPKVLWSDIGGQESAKQQLCEAVEWPLRHPEAFKTMGIRWVQGGGEY